MPIYDSILLASGFLPFRGSLTLDLVFVSMTAILLVMAVSIALVRKQKNYVAHKKIQIALVVVLAVVILAFEIDMRFFTDWRSLAQESRFYDSGMVSWMLVIHLVFAIPTPVVWGVTIYQALRHFPVPPEPAEHSARHRFWGRVAALFMLMTAVTGLIFYWMAFIA